MLYSAENSTISTDDKQENTSEDESASKPTPSWDESASTEIQQEILSPAEQDIIVEPAASNEATSLENSTKDQSTDPNTAPEVEILNDNESETTQDNDSGVDEEAIAKLLNESDDKDSNEEKEEAQEESPWKPEIEFGYQSRKGNDDNQSLNVRIAIGYIKGKMRNYGEVKIYREDEDGEEEEREQSYELQSDYKLGPKTYLYGSFKGIDSKYSSYFRDYTVSTGFGFQLSNTEKFKLEAEIGPGYRIQEPNTDEIDSDDPIFPENVQEAILRGNLTSVWKPFKTLSFEMQATVVSGSSNTRLDTEISAINNITEDIALKISHHRENLTRVPNDLENTDSTFKMNLLFRF
ncbi:MAG TPA: DUF481 domain-containing protein [Vibrio sp.]|nr:DUF481 domain-containing protein [Vibrio sp.]